MLGAIFPEGPAFFRGTFHARSHFPGRSCVFPGDHPCQEPLFWKVLPFSGGPSMPGAIFLEGPAFFRGTFHARGHFPGRSCLFPVDELPLRLHHPPKRLFWWMNLVSSGLVLSGHRAADVFLVQRGKRGRAVIVDNFFSIVHIFCIILYPGKF